MSERYTLDRNPPFEKRYAVGVLRPGDEVQIMSPWFATRNEAQKIGTSIQINPFHKMVIIWTYWQVDV